MACPKVWIIYYNRKKTAIKELLNSCFWIFVDDVKDPLVLFLDFYLKYTFEGATPTTNVSITSTPLFDS